MLKRISMLNSAVHCSRIATLDTAVNAWRILKDLYGREKGVHVRTVQLAEETARFSSYARYGIKSNSSCGIRMLGTDCRIRDYLVTGYGNKP